MGTDTEKFELVAKTFKGLENVLARELSDLGAENVTLLNRAVSFQGNKAMMYKTNLWLRTALKILKPIYTFKAKNEEELYKGIYEIKWSDYLGTDDTLAINSVVNSPYFNHSQFVALKSKDAIVDQFRNNSGKRPSVDTENPGILIDIHVSDDECIVSLDSSGESLHKRGYRVNSTIAPINEVLAAGLILLSEWDCKSNFIDPMCGSGTLPIEAALIAYNIPPGIFRKEFGFEKWNDFDADLFEEIYNDDNEERTFEHQIIGYDISAGVLRIAMDNVKNAFLTNKINLEVRDFEELIPPEGKNLIMMNPPYGERLKKDNIEIFYQSIGNRLKRHFTGTDIWIISGNKEALEYIGLHPTKKHTLYNGAIECKFQLFNIYEGSKKPKKNE